MTRAVPWRSLGLAAAALAVAALPGASTWLAADRLAIGAGQVWRIWSGHLVHGSPSHLAWNVAALVGLGILFERDLGRRFWKLIALSSVVIGAGTLILQPALDCYVGLSGVLNSIWVGGALICARKSRGALRGAYLGCVLVSLAKIAIEGFGGLSIFTDPVSLGGVPVPLAHALGCLAGCISPSLELQPQRISNRFRSSSCSPRLTAISPETTTLTATASKVRRGSNDEANNKPTGANTNGAIGRNGHFAHLEENFCFGWRVREPPCVSLISRREQP